MSYSYDFNDKLVMSQGQSASDSIGEIIVDSIPGTEKAELATDAEDRNGTDWWAVLFAGHRLSIDVKVREQDWARKGQDDLALETWSVIERGIVGWTRDLGKRTDYVLWFWKDTRRWCLVPFRMLLSVFIDRCDEWCVLYGTHRQHTPRGAGYHSECVFVPRREVWRAIYERFGGSLTHAA